MTTLAHKRPRQCGSCQLCCKLLPVVELNKRAGEPCRHQRHHKGCAIYERRPPSCALWNCRWLVNDDTDRLSRPDRSRYVIDLMPDFVEIQDNETGEKQSVEVVQIWVDPQQREAWRDPELLNYIERRAREGKLALIRWSHRDGMTVIAPPLASDHQWHEVTSAMAGPEHTAAEIQETLGGTA